MTASKILRLLNEALSKYGNFDLIEFIDYYYRDSYEGSCNWLVREKVTLQNVIDSNPDSTYSIGKLSIRDIIKYLETEDKALNYFPVKISVEYEDSKEAWEKMKEEHADEEKKKKLMLGNIMALYGPGYREVTKIYTPEKIARKIFR